ncbi:MAG TPA: glycoside hydrolase family 16 protein, partial [Spirochaetota bacterium]|nr:glycoside hydrolase family 16 protein [Spirochaetota bacterium]
CDAYHVFEIRWDEGVIEWYIDGAFYQRVTKKSVPGTWVFDDHKFYIILNLAVGGGWPGNPDSSTVFPQTMAVDWVRVYY